MPEGYALNWAAAVIAIIVGVVLIGVMFGPNEQGQLMNLDFNPLEVAAVTCSVFIVNNISRDGESNWLEGALLLGVYAVLGVGFFFVP